MNHFCWVDLAARDASEASRFYGRLFGWHAVEQLAHDGWFTLLRLAARDIGSLYQLARRDADAGVPSHWTPYVCVADVDLAATRAAALGGEVLLAPCTFPGIARVALIVDAVGAPLGLWEPAPGGPGWEADG